MYSTNSVITYPVSTKTHYPATDSQYNSHDLPGIQKANSDDSILLHAIASGSTTAMTQFYKKYHNAVVTFTMRHLSNRQDCLDVLNDVMLTVWTRAGSFAGRSQARTWLLAITYHKIMDFFRRHQRDLLLNKGVRDMMQADSAASDPDNTIDSAKLINACMEKLSAAHREVIHLAFYEDLSCKEIAEIISCPVGTVKTRLMHARSHLKRMLK